MEVRANMNVVLVIMDTLRQDHVGAYGNNWISTPNLDAFAHEAVIFTRCYPESLPTLPMRRALHTGLRTFPYRGHHDYKGDFSGAPGWGPIPEEQDTLAEIVSAVGYRTAFITDCYHQFKPSKNFHRGFHEWTWIRGQEADPYRSGPAATPEEIASHMVELPQENPGLARFLRTYLGNNAYRHTERDYYPARVFTEASRWIWDNQDADRIFLVVDSFDPHEPWDPPAYYRRMYDSQEDAVDVIQSLYAPWEGRLKPRELRRLQANYAGEVTMVDRWFGHFIETLRVAGLLDGSLVAVISDHGHNIGLDPGDKGLVSKQGHPMTHAVADLVMMIRHPNGQGAGGTYRGLLYNHDLTATLLSLVGVEPWRPLDGSDFWPKVMAGDAHARDYVTIGWGPLVTVITDEWWYNANIWGEGELLYAVAEDPDLEHSLAQDRPDVCRELLALAVQDAGGSIPEDFATYHDKPGCTPFENRSSLMGRVSRKR
ncbi:MAG TPA: sulfatase [Anaerolineae bacterium]|nr:sulfatase [Anaerolineae bacterium]